MIIYAFLAILMMYFSILAVCDLYQQRRQTRPSVSRIHIDQTPLSD